MKLHDILIVSDIDGTLLPENLPIPIRNREALQRFSAKGGRFTLATGRSIGSAGRFLGELPVNVPAVCLNVDVTDACQMDKKHLPKLGDGSVLYRNADSNPVLRQALESVAHTADIPLQMAVGRNITGGTDSSRIQLFSPRTAVVDISIPCKYMHTHYEQCSLKDIGSCIKLLGIILSCQRL